jgi:hypothetical protein
LEKESRVGDDEPAEGFMLIKDDDDTTCARRLCGLRESCIGGSVANYYLRKGLPLGSIAVDKRTGDWRYPRQVG